MTEFELETLSDGGGDHLLACLQFAWNCLAANGLTDQARQLTERIDSCPSPTAEPVAVRYGFDGHGYQYLDNSSGSDWKNRQPDGELLFTHAALAKPASPAGGEINAAQITMGRGLVDVTRIDHEGRSGILFRPRDSHIPVGEEGELRPGSYWPVAGDVVIWIENEGGAQVIQKYLSEFVSAPSPAGRVREAVVTDEMVERACLFYNVGWSKWHEPQKKTARETMRGALSRALPSPATPEPVSAPANGEVVKAARKEALEAFCSITDEGPFDELWPSVQEAVASKVDTVLTTYLAALSNPAPGHGEGGL